jgi:hypothetical protein
MFADVIGRIFSEAYLSLAVMLAVAAILITFVGAPASLSPGQNNTTPTFGL